jgi:hypothetical protein
MGVLRIALIGEGRNDYGGPDGYGEWKDGAAQPFIRKFATDAKIKPIRKQDRDRKSIGLPFKNFPKLGFHASVIRPYVAKIWEMKGEIDLLIIYKDLDKEGSGKAGKEQAIKSFQRAVDEFEAVFEFLKNRFEIPAIAMIPMRMLENWLLADENAFQLAFGTKPTQPRLPNEPEFIWGDEQNRDSNHPKNYIQRVLKEFGEDATTDNFILIAEATDLKTMEYKCPHSFAPFAKKMKNFAAPYI